MIEGMLQAKLEEHLDGVEGGTSKIRMVTIPKTYAVMQEKYNLIFSEIEKVHTNPN